MAFIGFTSGFVSNSFSPLYAEGRAARKFHRFTFRCMQAGWRLIWPPLDCNQPGVRIDWGKAESRLPLSCAVPELRATQKLGFWGDRPARRSSILSLHRPGARPSRATAGIWPRRSRTRASTRRGYHPCNYGILCQICKDEPRLTGYGVPARAGASFTRRATLIDTGPSKPEGRRGESARNLVMLVRVNLFSGGSC